MKTILVMEARTMVLLTGLAVGFGLAFHPIFFLIALGVVLLVVGQWTITEIVSSLSISDESKRLHI